MREERRDARRQAILDAAFDVLRREGYRGATMLAVAKEARASKETLYAWFGDKQGLFAALIEANAAEARAEVEAALAGGAPTEAALRRFGQALLRLLTGERAVAINRAAAADADADAALGKVLAAAGRETVLPRLTALIEAAAARGEVDVAGDGPAAAEAYLGLLLGDLPVRRIIGVAAAPTGEAAEARAARAAALWLKLYRSEPATRR